jgi:hypothetical protein
LSSTPGFKALLFYSLFTSTAYALVEVYLAPWKWLNFGSFQIAGLGTYHLLFMLPLFILISALPSRHGLASSSSAARQKAIMVVSGTFFFMLVAEDVLYFVFAGGPIEPGLFTTQWGYLFLAGQVVPIWYLGSAMPQVLCALCIPYLVYRDLKTPAFGGSRAARAGKQPFSSPRFGTGCRLSHLPSPTASMCRAGLLELFTMS